MRPPVYKAPSTIADAMRPYLDDFCDSLRWLYGPTLTDEVLLWEVIELAGDALLENGPEDTIERCFDALDAVLQCSVPPMLATYEGAICDLMLDGLSSTQLELARSYLGPRVEMALEDREAALEL